MNLHETIIANNLIINEFWAKATSNNNFNFEMLEVNDDSSIFTFSIEHNGETSIQTNTIESLKNYIKNF